MEECLDAFRNLPPEAVVELSRLMERLADLSPGRRIDWSDDWSDRDLEEFRAASIRRLDAQDTD